MEILDEFEVPHTAPDHAGFGLRFLAWLIDVLMISAAGWLMELLLGVNVFDASYGLSWFGNILTLLYFIAMEGGRKHATFGKQIMGIRVSDLHGGRIGYDKAAIRNIAKILSALILLIGFIMIIFSDKKQGLHDMIAQTLVIRIK